MWAGTVAVERACVASFPSPQPLSQLALTGATSDIWTDQYVGVEAIRRLCKFHPADISPHVYVHWESCLSRLTTVLVDSWVAFLYLQNHCHSDGIGLSEQFALCGNSERPDVRG